MQLSIRRPLLAALLVVTAGAATMNATATAATPRYLVIGASVTRLAGPALRNEFGDALQLEAVDGRSFIHPDNRGGPTIMEVFRANFQRMKPGDWVVIEMSHGGVDVATNRRYLREVVRLLPDTVCLAVVQPHTYYGAQAQPYIDWNRAMHWMQVQEIALQPCHAQIPWSVLVRNWTAMTSGLTEAQKAVGEPLLYDGRHPTPTGATRYAAAVAQAVGR